MSIFSGPPKQKVIRPPGKKEEDKGTAMARDRARSGVTSMFGSSAGALGFVQPPTSKKVLTGQ
jgi:hypothetical protein